MKKRNISVALAVIVLLSGVLSCASTTGKSYKYEEGSVFYFQKATFYLKGADKERAFQSMRAFELDKVLKILAHRYNITIDTSEFEDFLWAEDSSKVKLDGLVFKRDYIWESGNKKTSTVEFEFSRVSNDNSSYNEDEKKYNIFLKINGKKKTAFTGFLFDSKPVLQTIAGDLGYERLKKGSDEIYVNLDNKTQVVLTTAERPVRIANKEKEEKITQEKIKEQIKGFVESLPKEERNKFRDDIVKYLYQIIQ